MRRCRMLAFVVVGFLVAPSLWAQTTTGAIRGVVTDESGVTTRSARLLGIFIRLRNRGELSFGRIFADHCVCSTTPTTSAIDR
jgi:hypothetical protein